MSFSVQETLFSLLQHNAISGHENAVADVMLSEFRRQAKEVWRDRLGNVVARYGRAVSYTHLRAHETS
ncbi:hypothetical protein ACH0C5_17235, partial [Escherichia coli]